MSYIKQTTRPNLHKLSESELLNIIFEYDNTILEKNNQKKISRTELVDKIFEIWANYELVDHLDKPIECLICCDPLSNGNNLTFECGHKFHSICVIKHCLISSIDSYQNYINDKEMTNTKIEYYCPQCKKIIDSLSFEK